MVRWYSKSETVSGERFFLVFPIRERKRELFNFEQAKGRKEKREAITLSPADDSAPPNHLRLLF